jgi:mannose-6-phosphate isomerase-like protein (cupin superfamily)
VPVLTVLRRADLVSSPNSRTATFEGEPYGAGVSFFVLDADEGKGPAAHQHPYPEIFVPHAGRALFTVGGEQIEAGRDEIIVVGPDTPHGFVNIGPGRLEMVCIHANARMITQWLEG